MSRCYNEEITQLWARQHAEWDTVRKNYGNLYNALTRTIKVGVNTFVLQYNPERLRSSAANIDAKAISERPCFLCNENQPPEQETVMWEDKYKIQVNPYPIFKRHLTISAVEHTPQLISGRFGDMMRLARDLKDYVVFYNGPHSGASAPDHMHFQAGLRDELPICSELPWLTMRVINSGACFLSYNISSLRPVFYIDTSSLEDGDKYLCELLNFLPQKEGHDEPMVNILCWYDYNSWKIALFPRSKHRPSCYGTNDDQFIISPASVDLGGLIAVAREEDFYRLTFPDVTSILSDVCLNEIEVAKIADNLTNYYTLIKLTNYGTSSPS